MPRLPLKTADLGPGNLFPIYAAASKGINKCKHSKNAALPAMGELCVLPPAVNSAGEGRWPGC